MCKYIRTQYAKYIKQILLDTDGEANPKKMTVVDFKTSLSEMDRPPR